MEEVILEEVIVVDVDVVVVDVDVVDVDVVVVRNVGKCENVMLCLKVLNILFHISLFKNNFNDFYYYSTVLSLSNL